MESSNWPWWRRNGPTVVLLAIAAGLAFLVRSLWMYPLIQQFGPADLFGGGSDSFYHFRVSDYIILNHRNLIHDPLLKYPLGAINPREPLFDWMNAVLGILFAGFFGGNAGNAAAFFLEVDGPLWAALGVFPVYLIGREISDRRVGIIAGLLYAFDVANMDSSTLGYANYLSFYTFFILITIYAYLRTIRAAGTRKWVVSYARPREFPAALRAFFRTERSAVKWAVFTGVSFGALALAWQGYTFVIAGMIVFLIATLLIERIRRVDSFGLYVCTAIVGLIGFPMAMPYYWVQGLLLSWFGLPLLVFAGGLVICLPLVVLRDQPWVVSIPAFLLVGAAGIGGLALVNSGDFQNIVTGQGYFVKTLIYSTVAEAQAPSFDQLVVGYGILTFFLAFVGLALWVWRTVRGRFPRVMLMGLVFAAISIYLPISAAKFFFLGSAAFSILPAEAIIRALDVADLPKLRRTVSQLSDRRSQAAAFRRAFKARNVLIPVGLVLLLTFNTWYAIDAGISYNNKGTYSQQVYNSLPGFLQSSPANASSYYLGAAGTDLDTPPQYDEAGYNWLSQQDTQLTPPDRPAFVSWWDYGFQAIAQGDHPSVADNFQNGIDPSGNFLLAQNESLAIGVLTATLLLAEQQTSGQPDLPASFNALLAADGVNLTILHQLITNTNYDRNLVLAHPERYLAVDPSHIDGQNSEYDTISWYLASTRTTDDIAQLYDDVQAYTHWTIRYAMVDDRLFPYSGQSTGIFYAPADLTDRVISSAGIPTTYFNVNITGSDGNTYPYGALPSGVSAVAYPITYYPAFYNSMLYHIFIGYNASEAGLGTTPSTQIPGVTLSSGEPEPGWMLSHFQVVYETAYYCPYASTAGHPGCGVAMNLPTAARLAKANNGSVDVSESTYASSGGEVILAYYPGQPVTGTVNLPDGTPAAGVRLTVLDSFGIPHETVVTGSSGQYSLTLPPGNDTLNVTTGALALLDEQGSTHLLSIPVDVPAAMGYALHPTPMVRSIVLRPSTVEGIAYWNDANNASYVPNVDTVPAGAIVQLWGDGPTRNTTVDASGGYKFSDVPPGTYNVSLLYRGRNFSNSSAGQIYALPGQVANHTIGLGPATILGRVLLPDGRPAVGAAVQLSDADGPVANVTTDGSGNYTITGAPPGDLTLRASLPSAGLATAALALVNVSEGSKQSENLTLTAFGRISLTVLSGGSPVSGFAVRFVPILPFSLPQTSVGQSSGPGRSSSSPNGTASNGTGNSTSNATRSVGGPISANGTVLTTGATGTLSGALPVGNYSVYGLGLVGSTWSAGLATVAVGPGTTTLPPLPVVPAERLSGLTTTVGAAVGAKVEILAYDSAGDAAWTFTNDSGNWGLSLPRGSYSIYAVQSPSAGYPTAYVAMESVDLKANTVTTLTLGPGLLFRPVVGAASASPTVPVTPEPGTRVQLSLPSQGVTLTAAANASGNVTFYVPAALPLTSSFCLNATDPGFEAYSACGLTPQTVSQRSSIGLTANETALTVRLTGLSSSGSATLNITATGPMGKSLSLPAGATVTTHVVPGNYQLKAWSPAPSGTPGLYEQASPVNLTVPVGAATAAATVALVHVVASNATLHLARGVRPSNASIELSSSAFTTTVGGASYGTPGHFLVAPGSYSVLAQALGPGTWASAATISFNATGFASAALSITGSGTTLAYNLSLEGGTLNNTSLSGRLLVPSLPGWSVPIRFTDGRYVGVVPANLSLSANLSGVALVTNAAGSTYYAKVTSVAAPSSCVAAAPTAACTLELRPTPLASGLSGTVALEGVPGPAAATLELVGPGGSSNVTEVAAPAGAFNVSLAPGTYTLYARATGASAPYANLTSVTIGPNATTGTTLYLSPAWTDRVALSGPPGGGVDQGTIVVVSSSDIAFSLPNVSVGAVTPLLLPYGSYTLKGSASGTPYGVPVDATATVSAALFDGNIATALPLAWQFHETVAIHLPVASVTLGRGGNVSVPFSAVNTGDEPFAVRFVGSPATFGFTFAPSNASLGVAPTNDSVRGTVWVNVPNGTAVAHPPVQIEAIVVGPNGSSAGFAQPTLSINLTPYFGLAVGQGTTGGSSAAPFNISLPFYVRDTGNVPETLNLTVVDRERLAGLGWTARFEQGSSPITEAPTITVASNNSYTLVLNATPGRALPPGSVEIGVTVTNSTEGVRAYATLSVPTTAVSLATPGLTVTGPAIGAPPSYPDWLVEVIVFIPAIALIVAMFVQRWWKTRRWTRR